MKVALQRLLMFNNTTHRPTTIQRIRIGATKDGKITAIGHQSGSGDLSGGKADGAVAPTRMLYAGPNRMTETKLAVLDLAEGNAMRAPGEARGMMAFEIAMDEMAEKLGIDPVEFRIINDTLVVPDRPSPASSQDPQGRASSQNDKQPDLPFSQRGSSSVSDWERSVLGGANGTLDPLRCATAVGSSGSERPRPSATTS